MAKNKYYAVKKGTTPGIYGTWKECEDNTKGYNGALYKSFMSIDEAENYMKNDDAEMNVSNVDNDYDALVTEFLNEGRLVVFTDGGYNGKKDIAGYGVYILEPEGTNAIEISDVVRTDKFKKSNNITPELMAVTSAFDWAISNRYEKIVVFHDLEGIGKWGRNEWKDKADVVKWFVRKLKEKYNDILDIKYVWVKGHDGITYNEEADRLATEAINKNFKPQFKMSETYFSCQSVVERDVLEIIETIKKNKDICISRKDEKEKSKISFTLKYNKEKLTINFFRKNIRTLVQGSPNSLFSLFISYYTEKIKDFELVQAYAAMHKTKILINDIDASTKKLKLPVDFPCDVIKLIKQALSEKTALSTKSSIHGIYDYSHYIFPACRALEGTIKYLFERCGTHISQTGLIGGYFDKDSNGTYILKGSRYNAMIHKQKLEDAYNAYYRIRNSIGHFGELLNNSQLGSTTLIVNDPKEAINIINEILETIKFD